MAMLEPPQSILELLRDALPEEVTSDNGEETGNDEILAYVAFLAAGLADSQQFDASVWAESLEPYLASLLQNSSLEEVVDSFRQATEKATLGEDDVESYGSDDDCEELCDIRFNLAYGGKILLHQTKLRLRRGHRYGLVGQNGAGKTTLMTAITNGKLDGWPTGIRTIYVDSGSNVDPVHEARRVLQYLEETTGHSKDECVSRLLELNFTQQMMDGTIGSLSGGWQMKLRLVRAVLIDADIVLLDEPTNHLDKGTVKWLTDYLLNLHETTVITVSHGTFLIDFVCSTVIPSIANS
jgi:elongation factor 3